MNLLPTRNLLSARASRQPQAAPLKLQAEMIARNAAGKTAALTAINDVCEGTHLPSGLLFSVSDPLAANRLLQSMRNRRIDLQSDHGIESTQNAEELQYRLQEGDETRVEFVTHEVIGQILVGTTSDSPPQARQMYENYVERLRQANVLMVMVPAPTDMDDEQGRITFKEDLKLTSAYLRHALDKHDANSPCSVAIVMTKLDAMFSSEQDARAALSDPVLRQALSPLVHSVIGSSKVRDAVIVPTSSLGFGRTEEIENSADLTGGRGRLHRLIGQELEPFNIVGLLVWSLLYGLLPQTVKTGEQEMAIASTVQKLSDDLDALQPWLVPIKSRGQAVN